MPDDHGELLYSEAVKLGLYPTYGKEAGNADDGMVTYGVEGPGTDAKFGETEHSPKVTVVPPQQ